jgi:hypothetical protein
VEKTYTQTQKERYDLHRWVQEFCKEKTDSGEPMYKKGSVNNHSLVIKSEKGMDAHSLLSIMTDKLFFKNVLRSSALAKTLIADGFESKYENYFMQTDYHREFSDYSSMLQYLKHNKHLIGYDQFWIPHIIR